MSAKQLPNKPFSSIAIEPPLEVGPSWNQSRAGRRRQPLPTTLELGGQFAVTQSDDVVVLGAGAGATANLVCFEWLGNHNSFLQKTRFPKVTPYSATARLKFGDGRVGAVKHAADINVGIAGRVGRHRGVCAGRGYFRFIT